MARPEVVTIAWVVLAGFCPLPAQMPPPVVDDGMTTVQHHGATLGVRSGSTGIVNGDFSGGLAGWTVDILGGSTQPGTITSMGDARFLEGDSFLVELSQAFVMPATALTLGFDLFLVPGFDTTASFIPDAFEVSILDGSGSSVVPTWAPFATSFYNIQETLQVNAGAGVTVNGTRVTLDLTAVPVGTPVTLVFTLIGADSDTAGGVTIDDVLLDVLCTTPASWTSFGSGAPGTLGVPTIALSDDPVVGRTITLDIGNTSGTPSFACGSIAVKTAFIPVTPGFVILVDIHDPRSVMFEFPLNVTGGSLSLPIPFDGAWCGAVFYMQAGVYDAGVFGGFSLTPALQANVGY
jgi:hypothetical protein